MAVQVALPVTSELTLRIKAVEIPLNAKIACQCNMPSYAIDCINGDNDVRF